MTCRNFFHDLNSKCQQLEFNKFQISGVRGQFLQVLNSNSHLISFFEYLKNYLKIIFFKSKAKTSGIKFFVKFNYH